MTIETETTPDGGRPVPPLVMPVADDTRGIGWAVLAVVLFAMIFMSGKLAGGLVPALQIMWLRYLGGLITVIVTISLGRRWRMMGTRQPALHALRAGCGGLGGMAAIHAATAMPVANAAAIGLLEGLFTVCLGVVLLRERMPPARWAGGAFCLAGAVVVVFGGGDGVRFTAAMLAPALIALAGALLIAIESIMIKTLARSETRLVVLFYVNLFGAMLLGGPALLVWAPLPPLWLLGFLALGPVAIIGQTCNIQAYRLADAATLGPVRYTWIVFSALIGWMLFAEPPGPATLAGGALILAGGIWLARSGRGRRP